MRKALKDKGALVGFERRFIEPKKKALVKRAFLFQLCG